MTSRGPLHPTIRFTGKKYFIFFGRGKEIEGGVGATQVCKGGFMKMFVVVYFTFQSIPHPLKHKKQETSYFFD